jgi:glycosyltransferase involved in cell wall biosynthesis
MRIGVDARELAGHPTGVGRYVAELLGCWRCDPEASRHELVLYMPEGQRAPARQTGPSTLTGGARVDVRQVAGRGRGTWWEQTALPAALRADRPDVFFAPAYSVPLRARVPTVLTIHDVSFAAHPEWFTWREGLRRRWLARLSAARASVVLTDSAFSRSEIAARLGTPLDRIRVVPPGVSPRVGDAPLRDHADRPPLVLFVGTLFARRRLPLLIRAFARTCRRLPAARLAIVGENRTYPRQDPVALAADAGIGGAVTVAAYVDDAALSRLYSEARVFAFLSEYEGFGLTPLEALGAGVPVVMLDTPVAREVCGDAAWFVPPQERAVASALETLLVDPGLAQALLSRAPAVLARYSWERAARETLAALVHAGGRSDG